jgi:riboflavin synthase
MFTGIIEETGLIKTITKSGADFVITIEAEKIIEGMKDGDSINVNGVCLTVTSYNNDQFSVDVMPETLHATNLHNLEQGSNVNLERAMAANGRFGGHFVSGHIDAEGKIIEKKRQKNAVYYKITIPERLRRYVTMKGSIAVDGTSLTVFGITDNTFTISLIPHTLNETILGLKNRGDTVNIECDSIAKYIEQFVSVHLKDSNQSEMTAEFLKKHDF